LGQRRQDASTWSAASIFSKLVIPQRQNLQVQGREQILAGSVGDALSQLLGPEGDAQIEVLVQLRTPFRLSLAVDAGARTAIFHRYWMLMELDELVHLELS
jgi:hypothetical protein